MKPRTPAVAILFTAALMFVSATASAHYSFVNYQDPYFDYPNYEDPNYYGQAIATPYGYQIIITPPDAILYTDPPYPDEGRFERYQQRNFHPGYSSWREYYDSPPWHHQYDLRRNFHPYWMR